MSWTVETFSSAVDAEIEALDATLKARLTHFVELMKAYGPQALRMPHARHLSGPLWELRLQGPRRIGRAIYMTISERRVIILRVFVKKTQKTPKKELTIALERAKRVKE